MSQIDVEEYAGFGRRALASLIDSIVFGFISAIFYFLINGNSHITLIAKDGEINFFASQNWFEQLIYLLITVGMWIKFTGTPGKLLMGCHVVDAQTKQPLSLPQALIRYVGYFVSLLPLGLGFFWVIWDKRKQGFHDKLAKTIVIREVHEWGDDESQKTLEELIKEVK